MPLPLPIICEQPQKGPFWIGLIPAKFVNMNLSKAQQMTNTYVNRSTLEHYMGQSIQKWTK